MHWPRWLPVGTRSLLFGVHQFALHPLFVLWAWRRLYGSLPRDWRVWVVILIHDWGYWGCKDMDGPEGKWHPWGGAKIAARLLDRSRAPDWASRGVLAVPAVGPMLGELRGAPATASCF